MQREKWWLVLNEYNLHKYTTDISECLKIFQAETLYKNHLLLFRFLYQRRIRWRDSRLAWPEKTGRKEENQVCKHPKQSWLKTNILCSLCMSYDTLVIKVIKGSLYNCTVDKRIFNHFILLFKILSLPYPPLSLLPTPKTHTLPSICQGSLLS